MAQTLLKQRPAGKLNATQRSTIERPTTERPTTERQAATARAATLLKEILDYQERLNRLAVRSGSDEDYLINAYRRQIERRQRALQALPKPLDSAPNPWR